MAEAHNSIVNASNCNVKGVLKLKLKMCLVIRMIIKISREKFRWSKNICEIQRYVQIQRFIDDSEPLSILSTFHNLLETNSLPTKHLDKILQVVELSIKYLYWQVMTSKV